MTLKRKNTAELEGLPNIGKSIAADLRRIGIMNPEQLAAREPLALFHAMAEVMGKRHDPCVLYVLLAARHFLDSGEALPWWAFTARGKELLASKGGAQGSGR